MKKKIIYLEDIRDIIQTTQETLTQYDWTIVPNLLEFNGYLFKKPGVDYYDYVTLDLALDDKENPTDILKKSFPDMFFNSKTGEELEITTAGINILQGWDYFTRVIWEKIDHNKIINKVILLTGYAGFLKTSGLIEKYPGVKLIEKGDSAYYEIIKAIR